MINRKTAYYIFCGAWALFLITNIAEYNFSLRLNLLPFIHVSEIPFIKYLVLLIFALFIIPAGQFIRILNSKKDLTVIILLLLLLAIAYLSSYLSGFPGKAFSVTNRFSFFFTVFIIVLAAVKYFDKAGEFILKSFICSNILVIAGSLLDFYIPAFHTLLVQSFGRPEAIHSVMKIGGEVIMRPMGFLTDSNLTAFSVGMALLLLLLNSRHFNKIFRYAFYLSGSYVFGMLASRASLLMCIITLIVFMLMRAVEKRELIAFSVIFVLLQLATPQTYSRLLFYGDERQVEEEFAIGRPVIWEAAFTYFQEKPVIGAGPGVFFEVSREYMTPILRRNPGINLDNPGGAGYHQVDRLNPHNIFLVMLTETGLAGFTVFLALLVFLSVYFLRQKKFFAFLFLLNILLVSAVSNFAPYYKFYLIMCIMFYIASDVNMRLNFHRP